MESLLCLALSNAVAATLLAVFAAVVVRFCRRPSVRHALWLLVLLKLITPPLLPLSVTWPRSEESEPPPAESPLSAVVLPESLADMANGRRQPAGEKPHQPAGEAPYQPADAGRSPHSFADVWMPLLIVVWLGGALAWWSVAAVRLRKLQRLLRQARSATADVQEQGRRLAALLGLRRCPPIVFVSAPLSPMLWALGFSPRLLVPVELWRKLTTEQQDTLLAHELAHLRRGDHWVRRLEFLVLGLYWWHPVTWWARRRLQETEEECCDALVVAVLPDAASAYASALVETVAFLSQTRPAALVGASGAGHVPLLKRRLTMILKETSSRKPSRIGFWIVLGLGALLLPWSPRAARTEAPEGPKGAETTDRVAESPDIFVLPRGKLVVLTDEHTRELRKTNRRPPSATEPDRSQEIEKLQDEIELLKAQVRIKETHRDATRKKLDEYRRRLDNYSAANRQAPGTIPQDTILEIRLQVVVQQSQLLIDEAELQESLVRLRQTKRRLARLQRPAEKTDGGGRAQQEKRLRELEQKVENLLKEIHKMREDMRPNKPRDPDPEHKEARGFIYRVWPTLDTTRLEDNIPKAQKAFQKCKDVGDRISLQKLLKGTKGHADRLAKELAELHPELVIDDEIPAKKLKKVSEQIVKLGLDIEDYLKAHADDN